MSNTVTLAELRVRCRQRSNMEKSPFISEPELNAYINSSFAELYDLLVSKFEDYYTTTSTFTISSGNTEALPSDFYKLRGVDFQLDANNWVSVKKFVFAKRNTINRTLRSDSANEIQYRIVGSNLHIEPSDNATGNYQLWYTPVYTPLSADTDTVDGVNGWEEYIVIDVAAKMLAKEESSTTHLDNEKAAMHARIDNMAQNRDSGQPESITDTDGLYDFYPNRLF